MVAALRAVRRLSFSDVRRARTAALSRPDGSRGLVGQPPLTRRLPNADAEEWEAGPTKCEPDQTSKDSVVEENARSRQCNHEATQRDQRPSEQPLSGHVE